MPILSTADKNQAKELLKQEILTVFRSAMLFPAIVDGKDVTAYPVVKNKLLEIIVNLEELKLHSDMFSQNGELSEFHRDYSILQEFLQYRDKESVLKADFKILEDDIDKFLDQLVDDISQDTEQDIDSESFIKILEEQLKYGLAGKISLQLLEGVNKHIAELIDKTKEVSADSHEELLSEDVDKVLKKLQSIIELTDSQSDRDSEQYKNINILINKIKQKNKYFTSRVISEDPELTSALKNFIDNYTEGSFLTDELPVFISTDDDVIEAIEEFLRDYLEDINERQEMISDLVKSKALLQEKVTKIEQKLGEQNQEFVRTQRKLEGTIGVLETHRKKMEQKLSDANTEKLQNFIARIKNLRNTIQLSRMLDSSDEEKHKLTSQIQQHESRIKQLEQELSRANKGLKAKDKNFGKLEKERSSLKEQVKKLTGKLRRSGSITEADVARFIKTSEELEKLQKLRLEVAAEKSRADEALAHLEEIRQDIKDSDSEMSEASALIADLESRLSKAAASRDSALEQAQKATLHAEQMAAKFEELDKSIKQQGSMGSNGVSKAVRFSGQSSRVPTAKNTPGAKTDAGIAMAADGRTSQVSDELSMPNKTSWVDVYVCEQRDNAREPAVIKARVTNGLIESKISHDEVAKINNKPAIAFEIFILNYLKGYDAEDGGVPTVSATGKDQELVNLYYALAKAFEAAGMPIQIKGRAVNINRLDPKDIDKLYQYVCKMAVEQGISEPSNNLKNIGMFLVQNTLGSSKSRFYREHCETPGAAASSNGINAMAIEQLGLARVVDKSKKLSEMVSDDNNGSAYINEFNESLEVVARQPTSPRG